MSASVLTAELCRQTNMLVADHQDVLLRLQEADLTVLLADEFLKTRHRGRVSALLADLNPWKDVVFDASGVTSGVLPAAIAYWQQHTGPLSVRLRPLLGSLWQSDPLPDIANKSDIFEVPLRPRFLEKLLERQEPTRTRTQGLTCEYDPRYLALLTCAVLAALQPSPDVTPDAPLVGGYPTHPAWVVAAFGVVGVQLSQIQALQLQIKRRQYERLPPAPLVEVSSTRTALLGRYTALLDTACVPTGEDPRAQVVSASTHRTLQSVSELLIQRAIQLSLSAQAAPALTPAVPAALARDAGAPDPQGSPLRVHLCQTLVAMSRSLEAPLDPPTPAAAVLSTLLLNLAGAVLLCAPDKPLHLSDYQTLIEDYL